MSTGLLFALAILSLILIPLAPKLVRLRIRFFRWIHWNWAVNLLERHFQGWVLFFRIILFCDRGHAILCRLGISGLIDPAHPRLGQILAVTAYSPRVVPGRSDMATNRALRRTQWGVGRPIDLRLLVRKTVYHRQPDRSGPCRPRRSWR